ncbi:S-layer homology domain-containing protein [Paenibacillus sp. Leaf72]|uniref:S-layer homology domain-containing protein n=1 Tax=Paenibacillus sp. Leaf72 TaxID=1736234 RepID=UPI001F430861|nr:S-layer homology domain-containing protein [Paenibacillus sp. Leaf72]
MNALTNASTPTIDTEPTDKTVNVGDNANLSIAASGDATLSYQWYSNSTNSTVGGTPIGGATSASYSAPTTSAGTTYYYVVITNTDSSATGNPTATATSNSAGVTVNVLIAPDQPQNLIALGGDQQVTLNWSPSADASYYDIFIANASGQYSNTPIATVTGTSTIVQNLSNGTAYYFVVKAGGTGGLSLQSNEASTTPATVATAPTNVTAAAGNGQATVSFTAPADNGGSLITAYQITVSPGNATVTGTASPITITGLTNGTSYTFTVKALNAAGESMASTASNAVTPFTTTSNSGSGGSSPAVQPTDSTTTRNGVEVWINGKVENIGTSITSIINNRSTTTIIVDQKSLEKKLAEEGKFAVVTIPVSSQSDVIIGEINGQMLKTMEDYQATLEIRTDRASYKIPVLQINSSFVSAQLGNALSLQDIKIQITISTPTTDMKNVVNNAVAKEGLTLVAPAIEFTVKGIYGNKTFEITKFNTYVQRSIAIPSGIDPNKITTGVVVEPDGTVRHVPTKVVQENGAYFAQVNSLTNSTYAIVWHPFEFSDVTQHWAKKAVNDMGSRMIIEGNENGLFNPNRDISRAEFAAVIVRGLGLRLENGAASFSDVSASDWYSSAIHTAYAYHLIDGFEDGTFRPNDKITREQAMVIIAKAMTLTNLKAQLANEAAAQTLLPYKDAANAAEWAKNGIADSVLAGIVSGRTSAELAPKAFITRAEVAAIMQRLLQKSYLIQ